VHIWENFPVDHHLEIALGQVRLTPEFFAGGLPKKKIYLGGISILSILLSLKLGCHKVEECDVISHKFFGA
jgi:hypothetical protein